MTLAELVRDGRTTIDAGLSKAIDQQGFRADESHLARYGFWKAGTGPQLWGHQRAAIGTILAYLNADRKIPERPEQTEAALLKLPTGTGKSGIIAIVARCLPKIRRVLVLTPRQALTRQLLADIRYRFWQHIGYETKEGQLFTAAAADIGADLEALYSETLLPSTVVGVHTDLATADRAILVGTHQALDMIRKTAADNSPLLVDRFFSEWKLGIFLAVQQGPLIFMQDTEGLVLNVEKLGLKRADATLMEKAFPARASSGATRLSRLSFASLEMSQNAIRTMAVRTRSFADIFTDLLDPSLIPATAFGFVDGRARFVTFVRARIREAAERPASIARYQAWTRQVAQEFRDGSVKRSAVFDRYAQPVVGLTDAEATPVSILIDFAKESFIDAQDDNSAVAQVLENEEPDYDDVCADVDPTNNEFTIRIDGTDIPCSIEYRPKARKYRIASEALNQKYPAPDTADRRQRQTIVQRLNREQAFRVLVAKPGIVYSEGKFYQPRLRWITETGLKPVLDYVVSAPSLSAVSSEKGEKLYKTKPKWYEGSVFGLFSAVGENKRAALGIADDDLTKAIASYPVWLCDDDSRETADFIGINEAEKRIAFVHAKVGKKKSSGSGYSVTSLQESGRQAQASLVFISRGTPSTVWGVKRWQTDVQANTILLKGRNRVFRNDDGLPHGRIRHVRRASSGGRRDTCLEAGMFGRIERESTAGKG
jgi:hypothetical protein